MKSPEPIVRCQAHETRVPEVVEQFFGSADALEWRPA
jgi:hypothetical protein